jgi:hypothetical protein
MGKFSRPIGREKSLEKHTEAILERFLFPSAGEKYFLEAKNSKNQAPIGKRSENW